RAEVDSAISRAKTWLTAAEAKTQEDRAARLWALKQLDAAPEEVDAARANVLAAQRDDGGWAQLDEMESDAYATGQTLVVLHAVGCAADEPAFRRGIEFLLETQQPDGSW